MHIKTVKQKHVQPTTVPGLLSGSIEYEIKQGVSNVQWTGPKISQAVWHPILAFFKEVNTRHNSECQVRLYVNAALGEWAAWAFPQEARTSMSARELICPDAATQREQFKESDGWQYLGTVHHHCHMSAFQSGTDHNNERSQDGLHITVGRLGDAVYDIHARFYLGETEFEPDLSAFWDIGANALTMLEQVKGIVDIPSNAQDRIARKQMCQPAPADTVIPAQWLTNLIEVRSTIVVYPSSGGRYDLDEPGRSRVSPGFQNGHASWNDANKSVYVPKPEKNGQTGLPLEPEYKRKDKALAQVRDNCRLAGMDKVKTDAHFYSLSESEFFTFIVAAAKSNFLRITDVIEQWEWEDQMRDQARAQSQLNSESDPWSHMGEV